MKIPDEVRTDRLLLRPWREDDAIQLGPILDANFGHLGPWIPARVATPAPAPELRRRLAGFAGDFAGDREWRFGTFERDDRRLLGEVALFPRSATARVPFAAADRVELGYWLRADATGQGYVAEASRALIAVAASIPVFSCVEIRCDARNAPSAAIPVRLGFTLATTVESPSIVPNEPAVQLQVWSLDLTPRRGAK